jgi:hypothetical protein
MLKVYWSEDISEEERISTLRNACLSHYERNEREKFNMFSDYQVLQWQYIQDTSISACSLSQL